MVQVILQEIQSVSVKVKAREVIKAMQMGIVSTPVDMSEFFDLVKIQLKEYNVPPAVTATILAQCTNGTLEATIKTLELNNVQID